MIVDATATRTRRGLRVFSNLKGGDAAPHRDRVHAVRTSWLVVENTPGADRSEAKRLQAEFSELDARRLPPNELKHRGCDGVLKLIDIAGKYR